MTTANLPIAQRVAHLLYPTAPPIARSMALALIGAALLAISAKIQIPFYPVPQTLQTMIVLLVGMAYGGKLGVATVSLYLMAGAAGLPIFAGTPEKGIGWAYMIGPTGGYLLGFIFAAAACGMLARRGWDKNLWKVGLAMIIGNIIIYALGLLWLGNLIGWDKPVLQFGMLNFLLGDVVKIIFAAVALPPIVKAIRRGDGE
ncbi:MAG: biotin transporter BioY [Gammaproteobacteria bacterium WSBS_2016_MAG_OTU1]